MIQFSTNPSFSVKVPLNSSREFRVKCKVWNPKNRKCMEMDALIDTGATYSYIAERHAKVLELEAVSSVLSKTGAGNVHTPLSIVGFEIGNVTSVKFPVCVIPLPDDDMLIGMNMLSVCRFCYTQDPDSGVPTLFLELPH